jgi:predicted permease
MPESLESLMLPGVRTDLFVPMKMASVLAQDGDATMYTDREALGVKIIARLLPGINMEYARSRTDALSGRLQVAYPEAFGDRSFHLVPTLDVVIQPDFDRVLLMPIGALLMTMVGLVLLLACTNLANLLLSRGTDRGKEVAVRLALGASRGRLVGQFLSEVVVLGTLGCAAGMILAKWMLAILTSVQPPFWVPIAIDHGIDRSVFLFTLGVTVAAVLLAGLAPALRCTTPNLTPELKGEETNGVRRHFNLRSGLIACQLAISTVLLVGGGLFLRSLQEASQADPGFTTTDAGVIWLDLGVSGVPESEWNSLADELAGRARSLPGIEVVGTSNGIPLAVGAWSGRYHIPGSTPAAGEEDHTVRNYCVDQYFFTTMGIDLLSGRGIRSNDGENAERVLVVSEAAARHFWPGEDPLGKVILPVNSGHPVRVVGVARDIKLDRLDEAPQPLFYFSRKQHLSRANNLMLVARGSASPTEIAGGLRQIVRDADSELVVMAVSTLAEQFATMLFPFRAATGLLFIFGTLALLLSAFGIYGVVSFSIARRTREVGIRMSLGADSRNVTLVLVRGIVGVLLAGVFFGLLAAIGIAQFLRNFLISVGPGDLLTLVSVPLLLSTVAFAAALVPAHRASRTNPIEALRYD